MSILTSVISKIKVPNTINSLDRGIIGSNITQNEGSKKIGRAITIEK
jgi:hypothetical protein